MSIDNFNPKITHTYNRAGVVEQSPKPLTWQQTIKYIREQNFAVGQPLDKAREQAYEIMQRMFPGPYVIEEYFDNKKYVFDLRLKFEDPKQEMLWKIRYSEGS